ASLRARTSPSYTPSYSSPTLSTASLSSPSDYQDSATTPTGSYAPSPMPSSSSAPTTAQSSRGGTPPMQPASTLQRPSAAVPPTQPTTPSPYHLISAVNVPPRLGVSPRSANATGLYLSGGKYSMALSSFATF